MPTLMTIAAGVSNRAVEARTGKGWAEWFRRLDNAGCRKKSRQEIIVAVRVIKEVGGWWEQMITAAYEQERGLRQKAEPTDGYQVEVSQTILAAAADLFHAWITANRRVKWLPNCRLTVRKATPIRSLRVTLTEEATQVDVTLAPKGLRKTQVAVRHTKLRDQEHVKRMREFWSDALLRLAGHCAGRD